MASLKGSMPWGDMHAQRQGADRAASQKRSLLCCWTLCWEIIFRWPLLDERSRPSPARSQAQHQLLELGRRGQHKKSECYLLWVADRGAQLAQTPASMWVRTLSPLWRGSPAEEMLFCPPKRSLPVNSKRFAPLVIPAPLLLGSENLNCPNHRSPKAWQAPPRVRNIWCGPVVP